MKAVWRDRLRLQNYISGLFSEPDSEEWMENYSPATGKKIGYVPKSQKSDVDRAVRAAKDALPSTSIVHANGGAPRASYSLEQGSFQEDRGRCYCTETYCCRHESDPDLIKDFLSKFSKRI